jgi:uncharacterized RmlC-like cupin family protein
VVLEPGQGVEGHRHEAEDDSFLVVEGTLTLTVGDDRREVVAGPGTFVLVPAGTFHALLNRGPGDVRFLNVHAPGGFDRRIGIDGPPPPRVRRLSVGSAGRPLALLALLLALVAATGSGGVAAAAALAKNSVGSAQIKNGGVRTQDLGVGAVGSPQILDGAVTGPDLAAGTLTAREVADGSLTGTELAAGTVTGREVADGSITGAEVDESTLALPATPSVAESSYGAGTLSNYSVVAATITVNVPRNGFVDVSGSASLSAAAQSGLLQAELFQDDQDIQRMRWDAGDKDGQYDQHQSVEAVVPVTAGTHTYTLRIAEGLSSGTAYSGYLASQVVVRFFPEGSAPVGAARSGGGQPGIG